jgi:hypothetical protein
MTTLAQLRAALQVRRQERRRREQLRRELQEYRTSAEQHELQAILARYDTTVAELLAGREPRLTTRERGDDRAWEDQWDEIVLDLSSDD